MEGGARTEEVGQWAICCQVMDGEVMLLACMRAVVGVDMCAALLHLFCVDTLVIFALLAYLSLL
jgi:hypothetical protein